MAIYFSSDLHIGHLNALTIMPHRPWTDVEAMSLGLIERHNSVVRPEDVIIYVGDLIMGKKFENVPRFLPMLNGHKILVVGNHDFLPSEQKPAKIQQLEELYTKHGIEQIHYGCVSLADILTLPNVSYLLLTDIMICHFPPAETDDDRTIEYKQRYTELRPTIPADKFLLHGHTHSREHITRSNMIHVGVDAEAWDYKPVDFATILTLFSKLQG